MASSTTTSFAQLVKEIGETGLQVTQLRAAEGSAGNISVYANEIDGVGDDFSPRGDLVLPVQAPALAGGWVFVSGTGCRLRDLAGSPATSLCLLHIAEGGARASLYAGSDLRPTSELNSHLAIHADQVARRRLKMHSIVHAQPTFLTFLSHLPGYTDTQAFTRRLLRWEPETVAMFPEGIGMLPYQTPGTPELMAVTVGGLQSFRLVVWQRHGVVARSDRGPAHAADLIEYAETAAHYEYLNLQLGEPSQGLSDDELQAICGRLGIRPAFLEDI